MPRPPDHAAHVASAVEDLLRAVTVLIDDVRYAIVDSREVGTAAKGVGSAAKDVGAAAKAKSARLRRALKAYWAKMKGKARAARVSVMHESRRAAKRKAT
jgi:hypothetical protein